MSIEALATKAGIVGGKALARFLSDLANRNTIALQEAMEIDRRSHAARVAQLVEVLMVEWQKQAKDTEELKAKVEEMAADSQFHRLHANLEYEAVRSTLDDRKKMLAAAAAGLCDPNMSINEKARIERTLRHLDPEDAALLKRLADLNSGEVKPEDKFVGSPGLMHHVDEETAKGNALERCRRELAEKYPMSRGALVTAGCINTGGSAGPFQYDAAWQVTELGQGVLRALSSYFEGCQ